MQDRSDFFDLIAELSSDDDTKRLSAGIKKPAGTTSGGSGPIPRQDKADAGTRP